MRKKELLAFPVMMADPEFVMKVREDKGNTTINWQGRAERYHNYHVFYSAMEDSGLMQINIYTRKRIMQENLRPQFRVFLSKDEQKYLTYETETGRWLTARMVNLQEDVGGNWWRGKFRYSTEEYTKIVREFCGLDDMSLWETVNRWQKSVSYRSELEEIDAKMSLVPDYPADFDDWILKEGFWNDQYMMYVRKRKTARGYCTACGKEGHLSVLPVHNEPYDCPFCRHRLTAKSWKKQKYLIDTEDIGLLQPLIGQRGYVLRRFRCKVRRTLENRWKTEFAGYWEEERMLTGESFVKSGKGFIWSEYKQFHKERWCYNIYYSKDDMNLILYNRNLGTLRQRKEFRYIPFEEMFGRGRYISVLAALRGLACHPQIEILLKNGFFNLAIEAAEGMDIEACWSAGAPWKILGIRKEQTPMCRDLDIGYRELKVLRTCNEHRISPSGDELEYLASHIGPRLCEAFLRLGHFKRALRYFHEKLKDDVRQIGDYFDYIDDLETLSMPKTKGYLFPKNFQQIHANIAGQRQEREERIEAMTIKKKNMILKKMLPELKALYGYEDDQFIIVLPESKEDFNREGRQNHNCVGGSYFDKMLTGKTVVMFLRKKEEQDKSFCTVEMKGKEIVQCRAELNRTAPPEALAFMKKVQKHYEKQKIAMEKEALRNGLCTADAG